MTEVPAVGAEHNHGARRGSMCANTAARRASLALTVVVVLGCAPSSRSTEAVATSNSAVNATPQDGVDCGCDATGPYVSPAMPVPTTIRRDSTSPNNVYKVVVTGGGTNPIDLRIVKVASGATVLSLPGLPSNTYWGFSPDDDRFVYHHVSSGMDNIALYSLAPTPRRVWSTFVTMSGSRLLFSPTGRYFFYTALSGTFQTLFNIVEASTGAMAFQSEFMFQSPSGAGGDEFGVVGWGFGTDDSDRSFMYAHVTGTNSVSISLVNLQYNLASGSSWSTVHQRDTTAPSAFWKFSPCGNLLAIVTQIGSTQLWVDLIKTVDGSQIAPGQQIPLGTVSLLTYVPWHVARVGSTETRLAANTAGPACPVPPRLAALMVEERQDGRTPSPGFVAGGKKATGTVWLTAPAASSVSVALSSSDPDIAPVPASATVPAGAQSADFSISTSSPESTSTATITASFAGLSKTATLTVISQGGWSPAAWVQPGVFRMGPTVTLLPDGRVLHAGGYFGSDIGSAFLYDVGADRWSFVTPMSTSRASHTATLLLDGRVLVAGGRLNNEPGPALTSAEIYDPATDRWSPAGDMSTPHTWHQAILLPNGKVLVTGGYDRTDTTLPDAPVTKAELYDPQSNTWSAAADSPHAHGFGQQAVLLQSNKVLVVGGSLSPDADLYDPATNTWSTTSPMMGPRSYPSMTVLGSGRVLVVGGATGNVKAELYNPATDQWSAAATPIVSDRERHGAFLLPDGRVLVFSGEVNGTINPRITELYEPTANRWSRGPDMLSRHNSVNAVMWPDGRILATSFYTQPELYTPGGPVADLVSANDGDEDGLPDAWETNGIDFNRDGVVDLALAQPPYSASPSRRDLYVEIDSMSCAAGGCASGDTHTHQPLPGSITDLVGAFAGAPGGGITLHAMLDETIPEAPSILFASDGPGSGDDFTDLKSGAAANACDGRFGTASERASPNCANVLAAKRLAVRYALFGHSHAESPDSTGVAELPGNDFMVTLGSLSAADLAALGGRRGAEGGTFMHELGHTLGLRHGGTDDINCKPNYLSVMSYSLQFPTVDVNRPLDYSRELLRNLDELSLFETAGIAGPVGRLAVYGVGGAPRTAFASGPIDWNGNNNAFDGDIMADINGIGPAGCRASMGSLLPAAEDWDRLVFSFRGGPNFADGAHATPPRAVQEITAKQAVRMATVANDAAPPSCTFTDLGRNPEGHAWVRFTMHDQESGLRPIDGTASLGASLEVPPFDVATLDPITVTATALARPASAQVEVRSADFALNPVACRALVRSTESSHRLEQIAFTGVPGNLHTLALHNSASKLLSFKVIVNGHPLPAIPLKAGEWKLLDIGCELAPGDCNTVTVKPHGPGATIAALFGNGGTAP